VSLTVLDKPRMRDALAAIASHVRSRRPELVFSSFGHVTAALAAIVASLRPRPLLVAREPNLPSLSMAGGGINRWLRLACRLAYPRCDLVFALSDRMAAELEADFRVPRHRLLVLPNPIDEAPIRALAVDGVDLPRCRRLFVASGRMVPQKGFDRLIALWPTTRDGDVLMLLGDGPDRPVLEQQVARLGLSGRVHFLGYSNNPWALYARADALLMPSRFEGMPNAALEALACGTPVIATPEAGGLVELVPAVIPAALSVISVQEFSTAIDALCPRQSRSLRASLLPPELRADQVIKFLAERLRQLAA
jgi:glycosyltransferase involved in cell wall biosynthesis